MFGFLSGEPFLEEGGERMAVDDLFAVVGTDDDLTIACEGYFAQMVASAVPMGQGDEFINENVMDNLAARECVVQSQGAVFEVLVEVLGLGICGR